MESGGEFSLYIHIPFCRKKCAYCDFYSVTDLSLTEEFLRALLREIRMRGKNYDEKNQGENHLKSLYIGGGTPSILPVWAIETILDTVGRHWPMSRNTEITCEINPGTVDRQYLSRLKNAGVNRLSMGIQSLDDRELAFLGRIHDKKQAVETIDLAWGLGFENICADIIYGIHPGSETGLHQTLAAVVDMPLTHLSCYMLTLEPGTPLYETGQQNPGLLACGDTKTDLLVQVSDFLTGQGLIHYEVSNFARGPEYCSVHNQGYWNGSAYLGLGPSAHSFSITEDQRQIRFWNMENLAEYISRIRQGRLPVEGTETLTREQQMTERIMLGLRTARGIDLNGFYEDFGPCFQPKMEDLIQDLETQNMGKKSGGFFSLNTKGWTFLDHITEIFVNTLDFP
ncbi:MAG: coproporphyrinogen III oxidase [Desulfobacterales bacterium]|nr:MAG: coproporphyrinogen III oxidase [Desulfobacterales bacterium]